MPGLRRLRDPRRGAELPAGARHPAREHRLHLRDRLRGALPVLRRDLRDPLDPRPRAGDRDRARALAARSLGVGRDRRRRRALDRRQPPDPRAAPQREREDPDVQQPDLRADEGPVLADLAARDGEQDDADGLGRLPVQPGRAGARRGGDLRRALDRHRPRAPDRDAAPRARPPGRGLRRDLPELQRLQRRRLRRGTRPEGEPDPARPRRAGPLRRRGRARGADAGRTARPRSSTARPRTSCSSTTSTPRRPRSRTRWRGSRTRRTARPRSASSATSSARSTTACWTTSSHAPARSRARATSASSCTPATPGRSAERHSPVPQLGDGLLRPRRPRATWAATAALRCTAARAARTCR